ncbi:ZIP family metal transporter [Candidatus Beckwithbacteria bacterium]|nr:ZIP family metal transporter [Candidatus Beckwithbacteria bacterium]
MLIAILLSTTLVSLIGFAGVLTLSFKRNSLQQVLVFLVALSAGTMLGGAFLHLIPESIESLGTDTTALLTLLSFCLFFLIEKILHWRHCHKQNCKIHTFGYMNLVGDSIHNFIDGLIIASTFSVSSYLGMTTLLAIVLHEIPQEIGDFGVLLHAGFTTKKALFLNVGVAFTALLGGLLGYYLSGFSQNIGSFLLPLATGGFLYIPTSDLIPELRKETHLGKSLLSFIIFLLGIVLMYSLRFLE